MLLCDQYVMPQTLKEALTVWGGAPEGSRLIAGGTDILPWAREGRAGDVRVPMLVDLSKVTELSGYVKDADRLRLGANTVFQQFLTDDALRKDAPCMPYCAIWFADDQIREQATLMGNLVNASPAADGTPAIMVLNGSVEIAGLDENEIVYRSQPIEEFILGPGRNTLEDGEIAIGVVCDALPEYGGAFEKVGQRRSLVISTVCTACLVKPTADSSTFADIRLAMGGIGPVPTRLKQVESFLAGKPITSETIKDAAQMTQGLVQSRTRQGYRKLVVEGFIERALCNALSECGIELPSENTMEMSHA